MKVSEWKYSSRLKLQRLKQKGGRAPDSQNKGHIKSFCTTADAENWSELYYAFYFCCLRFLHRKLPFQSLELKLEVLYCTISNMNLYVSLSVLNKVHLEWKEASEREIVAPYFVARPKWNMNFCTCKVSQIWAELLFMFRIVCSSTPLYSSVTVWLDSFFDTGSYESYKMWFLHFYFYTSNQFPFANSKLLLAKCTLKNISCNERRMQTDAVHGSKCSPFSRECEKLKNLFLRCLKPAL